MGVNFFTIGDFLCLIFTYWDFVRLVFIFAKQRESEISLSVVFSFLCTRTRVSAISLLSGTWCSREVIQFEHKFDPYVDRSTFC